MLTVSQAAKILGVNKKTLMRWDDDGWLKAKRDPLNNARLYDEAVIRKIARWYDLRRRHREHLAKLSPIRKNVDRFLPTTPLDAVTPPKLHNGEEMKLAYSELHKWEEEMKKIYEEYGEFTDRMYGQLKT